MLVRFLFLGEGTSDEGLVPHLEDLCIAAGADEVSGLSPDFSRVSQKVGRGVGARVQAALMLEPSANLIFIHRDADSRDPEPRYQEISAAAEILGLRTPYVCVVPVQELESWLLLDEREIRRVAENPNGRIPLNLPSASTVENVTNPKERLKEVLLLASETSGRRRQRFASRFDDQRRLLLERLDHTGPLTRVRAWRRLLEDVRQVLGRHQWRD